MGDLLLTGIGELTTNRGTPVADAAVSIENGIITYAGPAAEAPTKSGETIDCEGRAVIPGFVDAHTHLVFGGERGSEFSMKMAGASYQEIAEAGGGILSTVKATRALSEDELFEQTAARAMTMVGNGTTTLEIKSGYGLDLETELRSLRVAARIGQELPLTVKTTFLGAHTVPLEYRDDPERYVSQIINEMLPAVSDLADYCDVFVEEGAFSVDQARRILTAGRENGLAPRIHAEQLTHSGGAALAAELGAVSADHLDHVTEHDARLLAEAGVTAVLTPGASYSLRADQAPGPMLAEAGCTIALATDCNPGTSYFESMGPIISLATVQMGLTVEQAIAATTEGGARSLGFEDRGWLGIGAVGDLAVLDAPSATHLAYRPASALVSTTIKSGRVVDV